MRRLFADTTHLRSPGAWADAMDRRLLLIIASCGLAAASVLLWLQAAPGMNNVWMVLSLLAVQLIPRIRRYRDGAGEDRTTLDQLSCEARGR